MFDGVAWSTVIMEQGCRDGGSSKSSGVTGTRARSVNIRPVRNQHTVTKSVLKGFAGPSGTLAVYNAEHRVRQLKSPGAGIFTTRFDTYDSRGAEERWNGLETNFPPALVKVRARTALGDPATVSALKDLLALHWSRSRAIMISRDDAARTVLTESMRDIWTHPGVLRKALRDKTGLEAAGWSELEWINATVHDQVFTANAPLWHSRKDVDNYNQARAHFEKSNLVLGFTDTRDLVICDSPVITTRKGMAGTGPHQGIALFDADHIAMPITPNVMLALGPKAEVVTLSDEIVEEYNRLQWLAHHGWVAARPGGVGDSTIGLRVQLEGCSNTNTSP